MKNAENSVTEEEMDVEEVLESTAGAKSIHPSENGLFGIRNSINFIIISEEENERARNANKNNVYTQKN